MLGAKRRLDVLVVGGGVVGNVFVASLLHQTRAGDGIKIGVIDLKPPPVLAACLELSHPDVRVYALSPSSIGILKGVGAWESIKARAYPYKHMYVWEEASEQHVEFSAASIPAEFLGMIAEDKLIHAAVAQRVHEESPSIDYTYGASVHKIEFTSTASFADSACEVTLKHADGSLEAVSTKLLVGADGAGSGVRRLGGLSQWGWTYGQDAVVATVKTDVQHDTAWQRYLASGPIALLPLWGKYSSIVWSASVAEAARLRALTDSAFKDELNSALQRPSASGSTFPFHLFPSASASARAPPLVESIESPRLSFPLQFQQAKSYVRPRIALIGDAAHSIHPQAGQGLNLGIRDAHALASVVASGLVSGGDIGLESLLSKYDEQQTARNVAMMSSVDSINTMFVSQNPGVRSVRSIAMKVVNELPFLKSKMAKFAMGL